MSAKKRSSGSIIGAQGITLVARRVLEMGFVWYPTDANLEVGIDGTIELRDPTTEAMLNTILQVQSRATSKRWVSETSEAFEYVCDERELSYWTSGNVPVLLVCSRPESQEAYWVSIKDYFRDPVVRQTRRVRFDKHADRFDVSARSALLRLGLRKDAGVYLAPPPVSETLMLNIAPVTFAETVWVADTEARGPGDVWRAVSDRKQPEWLLHAKRLISFRDLTEPPWRQICDQGTAEPFSTAEWASHDENANLLVRLLGECLRAKLAPLRMGYYQRRLDEKYLYFHRDPKAMPRVLRYRSLAHTTSRNVVELYTGRQGFEYVRHNALATQFHKLGDTWYVSLTPTYHFTDDGERPARGYQRLLSGIKRLERHAAVMGQVVMWADLLKDPQPGESLFDEPFLSVGPLVTVSASVGIDDNAWVSADEDPPEPDPLPLFSTDEEGSR